jgi:hypothetical protein
MSHGSSMFRQHELLRSSCSQLVDRHIDMHQAGRSLDEVEHGIVQQTGGLVYHSMSCGKGMHAQTKTLA